MRVIGRGDDHRVDQAAGFASSPPNRRTRATFAPRSPSALFAHPSEVATGSAIAVTTAPGSDRQVVEGARRPSCPVPTTPVTDLLSQAVFPLCMTTMSESMLTPDPRPLGKSGILAVSPIAWGMWRFGNASVEEGRPWHDRGGVRRRDQRCSTPPTSMASTEVAGFGDAESAVGAVFWPKTPQLRERKWCSRPRVASRRRCPYDSSRDYLMATRWSLAAADRGGAGRPVPDPPPRYPHASARGRPHARRHGRQAGKVRASACRTTHAGRVRRRIARLSSAQPLASIAA